LAPHWARPTGSVPPAAFQPEAGRRAAAHRQEARHARGALPDAHHLRVALTFAARRWAALSDARAQRPEEVAAAAAAESRAWPPEAGLAGAALHAAGAAVVAPQVWPPVAEAAAAQHAAGEAAAVLRVAVAAEAAVVVPAALPPEGAAVERPAWQARQAERPSAAASAFRPDPVLPWPAPPRSARFARARRCLRIASL
jgi:hypothetical protein